MSGWGMGWFGGGPAKKKDAPKKAILQLRSTLEMLNKRERHLQNQMDEEDAKARKFVGTNKAGTWNFWPITFEASKTSGGARYAFTVLFRHHIRRRTENDVADDGEPQRPLRRSGKRSNLKTRSNKPRHKS